MLHNRVAEIIIPNLAELDYSIPFGLDLEVGDIVIVPFRNTRVTGIVWKFKKNSEFPLEKLKSVEKKTSLSFANNHLKFIEWIANYYLYNYGHVLRMFLPNQVSSHLLKDKILEVKKPSLDMPVYISPEFNPEQFEANNKIRDLILQKKHNIILDGVTGSGKTEIYLNAANLALENNGQVLIILPEIALTSQIIDRIAKRFTYQPIIWHSSITDKYKRENFLKIYDGTAKIVIGARSALFLPFKNLKMIIIDEEHEQSYKQEDGVTYQARDMALMLAKIREIPIILASASPSLESINNVNLGKLQLVKLSGRYNDNAMPKINILDMKKERRKDYFIAPKLISAIKANFENNLQSLLFINRKGYSPSLVCSNCGNQKICRSCSCAMVYHKTLKKLKCHQCGSESAVPKVCPECFAENSFIPCGPGIERLAEEINELIPNAKIICLTQETFYKPKEAEIILTAIKNKEYDIIIGTQIVAKGHHFPALTLVGIIDADSSMMAGDLRASEKTYQLLQQVSGRAGRELENSNIYIQTFNPEHPLIVSLANYERESFITQELKSREMMAMPPFAKLGSIILSSKQEAKLIEFAKFLLKISPNTNDIQILGPAPALHYKVRDKYRFRFLIKCRKNINIQHFFKNWLKDVKIPSHIHLKIDIDPYYFA